MYSNKIKKIRKEKGIKQEELARNIGISSGYLSHLESGSRKNPSIVIMNKISKALGKSISEIFFE